MITGRRKPLWKRNRRRLARKFCIEGAELGEPGTLVRAYDIEQKPPLTPGVHEMSIEKIGNGGVMVAKEQPATGIKLKGARKAKGTVSGKATIKLWDRSYSTVMDTMSKYELVSKFIAQSEGEAFTIYQQLTLKNTTLAIADKISAMCSKMGGFHCVIKSDESKWLAVEVYSKDELEALVIVSDEERRNDVDYDLPAPAADEERITLLEPRIGVFGIMAVSRRDFLFKLWEWIKNEYHSERFAQVKWWYRTDGGQTTYRTTYLEDPHTTIHQEYYPDTKDPDGYIKQYLKSDAAILLMAGPPGTGKTTLLRHMIYKYNLTASVVYDEELMKKDSVFQSFLFGKGEDILIIEDADTILTAREGGDNKLMSRFLNVSDGLIKLPNKKLVFTTNITDFSRIDPALMRPGRCFGRMETRELSFEEAVAAAKVAKVGVPTVDKKYTIAELFNPGEGADTRRVGFR